MILMWNFFKKLFSNKESENELYIENKEIGQYFDLNENLPASITQINEAIQEVIDPNSYHSLVVDNYDYGFGYGQLSDLEISFLKLKSYSGYTRQQTLESLANCFDATLFPHLLDRLSDYVPINRQLALEHLLKWSTHSEFAQLCIIHFLQIAILQKRERTEQTAYDLLLQNVAQNQVGLKYYLTQQQGRLARALLDFTIQYQWIEEEELVEWCRVAKDQKVRAYWVEYIILHQSDDELIAELEQTNYRDVKYHLFDVLYQINVLKNEHLVPLWHSRFLSIMDYAYFALKQNNFDFDMYFNIHPLGSLTLSQARIRAYQWVIMKGDIQEFYKILDDLQDQSIVHAVLCYALQQQYLQIENYLNYYQNNGQLLNSHLLSKAKKYTSQSLNVDELTRYLALHAEDITIQQKFAWVEHSNIWDQLYWYVIQFNHAYTSEDMEFFDNTINRLIAHMKYATYSPLWSKNQIDIFQQQFPKFIQEFPQILENSKIRQILETKLKNEVAVDNVQI